ncbi:MAG TPA: diaminopimelate decarboxylase [Labilithrix sp.]
MATTRRVDGTLELGGLALADIANDPRIPTPAYVYDLDAIAREARELREAFAGAPHLVAYAVKANSAGAIVRALAAVGCGADVVSGAELALVRACGVPPERIVYSGVAKTDDEIDLAIAEEIRAIQIESVEEIDRVGARAALAKKRARVSLRINPGLDAEEVDTHRHISTGHDEAKFGVPLANVPAALERIARAPHVEIVGLTSHVGSQITNVDAYLASARAVFELAKDIRARVPISYVDTGGGFGIDYGAGKPPAPAEFVARTRALQKELGLADVAILCEPGRALVGAHGVLLARVIQRKDTGERRWTMIDAGMNDLMRPALYQAFHRIVALGASDSARLSRVVGPVCESSDDFGLHELPDGDIGFVAILDAGAYGYSMASRYNGRALPSEVFLRDGAIAGFTARSPASVWVEDRLQAGT